MPVKILIVEDHPDSREVLKIQIEIIGYEVIEAASGEEALNKAVAEHPDLVIMDLGLPGISGLEATTRLKADPKTARIPVVGYSAYPEDLFKQKAQEARMAAFLTKPTLPRRFKEVIEKLLHTGS